MNILNQSQIAVHLGHGSKAQFRPKLVHVIFDLISVSIFMSNYSFTQYVSVLILEPGKTKQYINQKRVIIVPKQIYLSPKQCNSPKAQCTTI